MQSGFRPGYVCVTATLKVLNDVTIALDSKQYCAAIFIDLVKAFDMVDHSILVGRLRSIVWCLWPGLLTTSKSAVYKVRKSAVSATACHQAKGVPQGSILGPTLFSIQQHSLGSSKLSQPFICR